MLFSPIHVRVLVCVRARTLFGVNDYYVVRCSLCGNRSTLTTTPNTSQSNKRTNSNHRRDKARDKTSYSQRDKASNNTPTSVSNNR